jgi:hypothetical protein
MLAPPLLHGVGVPIGVHGGRAVCPVNCCPRLGMSVRGCRYAGVHLAVDANLRLSDQARHADRARLAREAR